MKSRFPEFPVGIGAIKDDRKTVSSDNLDDYT